MMAAITGYVRGFSRYNTRSEPRMATSPVAVKINSGCRRTYGYARDVSSSGIQIRTFMGCEPEPGKAGDRIALEFLLPDCGLKVECKGEVMWNLAPEHGLRTMNLQGVRFTEIDDGVRERISECVRAHLDEA